MLKKLLTRFGVGLAASGSASGAELYKPYAATHANFLYNLLFCDDLELFKNKDNTKGEGLWPTLLAQQPDKIALRKIAFTQETRKTVQTTGATSANVEKIVRSVKVVR